METEFKIGDTVSCDNLFRRKNEFTLEKIAGFVIDIKMPNNAYVHLYDISSCNLGLVTDGSLATTRKVLIEKTRKDFKT